MTLTSFWQDSSKSLFHTAFGEDALKTIQLQSEVGVFACCWEYLKKKELLDTYIFQHQFSRWNSFRDMFGLKLPIFHFIKMNYEQSGKHYWRGACPTVPHPKKAYRCLELQCLKEALNILYHKCVFLHYHKLCLMSVYLTLVAKA